VVGSVAYTDIIKCFETVMILFIFRAINVLLVIQTINFAHTKRIKIIHSSFLHVIFAEQFPLRVDIIIDVRRPSMNYSHLSTDRNSKYLPTTVPRSATSTGQEYLLGHNVSVLQIRHKLR
jgi:hypothetical protein